MSSYCPFLNNLWRDLAGLPEIDLFTRNNVADLRTLRETEFNPLFRKLKDNRLVMGAFRYGRFHDPNKPHWDYIKRIYQECILYEEDGNLEHLVDISNMAELEFQNSRHPKKHFRKTDDGLHCVEGDE